MVGFFVQLLRVRIGIIGGIAMLITLVGVYTLNNSTFDMWVMLIMGVLGYFMRKFGFEPAPLVLAFVLGAILEESFRQSMLLSDGSLAIFATRPISAVLSVFVLLFIASSIWGAVRKDKKPSIIDQAKELAGED